MPDMKLWERHREFVGQVVRFGLTGVLLTLLVAGGYWICATALRVEPMLSFTLNFLVFTGLGYVLHSRFSFRGHGARGNAGVRAARFFTVNVIGFLTSQFFIWLLVKQLGGPVWWSVIPIVFVTPIVTFSLNRQWVFAS
ncbi:MAG TPA: GtrA family protein [Allosphingosinicella sp.]|jgi:putative flippase GtrA|nr:GtrA family protein [Allosphingosinicella sp.]